MDLLEDLSEWASMILSGDQVLDLDLEDGDSQVMHGEVIQAGAFQYMRVIQFTSFQEVNLATEELLEELDQHVVPA